MTKLTNKELDYIRDTTPFVAEFLALCTQWEVLQAAWEAVNEVTPFAREVELFEEQLPIFQAMEAIKVAHPNILEVVPQPAPHHAHTYWLAWEHTTQVPWKGDGTSGTEEWAAEWSATHS